jgi:hypothetical protein
MPLTPHLTQEVYLGRQIPDRTALDLPAYCALDGGRGLVTIPFAVYGQEQAKREKAGFFIEPDGTVSRRILPGLAPEATIIGCDRRDVMLAWIDANRMALVAINSSGRHLWQHRLRGMGCARPHDGLVVVGSVADQLRRIDRTGALLHDFDPIFQSRPFAGPHGVDLLGNTTLLADPDTTHSVWIIDTMGNPRRRVGTTDPDLNRAGKGLLHYPFDVVALNNGDLWVAEQGRARLTRFDPAGQRADTLKAQDFGAEEICTSRIFTTRDRRALCVFARRHREVWLLRFHL